MMPNVQSKAMLAFLTPYEGFYLFIFWEMVDCTFHNPSDRNLLLKNVLSLLLKMEITLGHFGVQTSQQNIFIKGALGIHLT